MTSAREDIKSVGLGFDSQWAHSFEEGTRVDSKNPHRVPDTTYAVWDQFCDEKPSSQ